METARGLGELLKNGWKPKRTIILASWDGEESGLLGSTEWAEKHADELAKKAVVYINSDSTGKGWLSAAGSHSLQAFVNDVVRDIQDPKRGTTLFQATTRSRDRRRPRRMTRSARSASGRTSRSSALGSGSDYTAFLDHLTVASLDLGFGGDGGGGIYHSDLRFVLLVHALLRHRLQLTARRSRARSARRCCGSPTRTFCRSSSPRRRMRCADTSSEIDKLRAQKHDGARARPGAASDGHRQTGQGCAQLDASTARVLMTEKPPITGAQLAELNRLLYTSERALQVRRGLPRREWFKHLAYAPGFYTGYGVKTLPGIREGIEQKQWDEARTYIPIVAEAIDRLADQVEKAAALAQSP